jgi:hypothetical protein
MFPVLKHNDPAEGERVAVRLGSVVRNLFLLTACTCALQIVAAQNIIVNGDFETGPFNATGAVSGWTVNGNVMTSSFEGATSGTHSAAFSVGGDFQGDMISQTFSTIIGQAYVIDFDAGVYGIRSGTHLLLEVQVIGAGMTTIIDQFVTPPDGGNFNAASFEHYGFVFTADSMLTTLKFSDFGLGNSNADVMVDSVLVASYDTVPPTILSQPVEQIHVQGQTAYLSITVAGSSPLNYQWFLNGKAVGGATSSILTVDDVQLVNAGTYTVVVANAYGAATSEPAKLTVLSKLDGTVAKQYPTPPPIQPGKDSLVFITHGRTPDPVDTSWIYQMAGSIATKVSANWSVGTYEWVSLSHTDIFRVCAHAETAGAKAGKDILSLGEQNAPGGHWNHIHFIAHSAGAALVHEAANVIKAAFPQTEIHTTLLDPYMPSAYRRNSYGSEAVWADNYFDISSDTLDELVGPGSGNGLTDGSLPHAHNVDVTAADPIVTPLPFWCAGTSAGSTACRYQPRSTHHWPITFYQKTIDDPNYKPDGYGFGLSKEAGGWSNATARMLGNNPPHFVNGTGTVVQGPFDLGAGTLLNYATLPNAHAGAIGTSASGFTAAVTGSTSSTVSTSSTSLRRLKRKKTSLSGNDPVGPPAWISVPVETHTNINYIQCDISFGGAVETSGLVTVYWNDVEIGTIDQDFIIDSTRTYVFQVGSAYLDRNNCLGFRLDPFSNSGASISVANVKTGFVGLAEPPKLSIANDAKRQRVLTLTGTQGYTFLVQASTDLTNWVDISGVSLSEGNTAQFPDLDGTNFGKRFYRVVSP